jgi:hypothetical protein
MVGNVLLEMSYDNRKQIQVTQDFRFCPDLGVSVHWLGDFVFVESGLGVRVKFDLNNTVYLTVTAEHMATTRGLCGLYNNNADGESCAKHSTLHLVSKY